MNETSSQVTRWRMVAIIALILLIVVSCMSAVYLSGKGTAAPSNQIAQSQEKITSGDPLSFWVDGAETKTQLTSFMATITDENSADYIPVERRVAVFDLDGTLFGETNPIYFDHCLLLYRVLQDPDYKDKASDFEKETCYKILEGIRGGFYPEGMDTMHGQAVASAFAGMEVDEFVNYCIKFGEQEAVGYDGLLRGDLFFKPMLQIIDYLQANEFKVFVVSGTDRLILRGIAKDKLDLPYSQIIGSDESIVATSQVDTDGLEYQFTKNDKLILGGDFITKNLKMNKVGVIAQEIGVQPVLSFGNSTGDSSMAEYVTKNNDYQSLAFMLCCDDLDREYGNESKAQKMKDLCAENGWVAVSMRDDWTTIYGDDVTKNPDKGFSFYNDYEIP